MDISDQLSRAARITWQHKTLWWLGLLPGLTHVATSLARLWVFQFARREYLPLLAQLPPNGPPLDQWLFTPDAAAKFFNVPVLIGGTVWLFLVGIVFWLLLVLAEAAIVTATLGIAAAKPLSVGESLASGRRFLGRFVAIDAFLFFPWFLIALAALIVLGLTAGSTAVLAVNQSTTTSLFSALGLGLSCAALLACLLIPVSFVTLRFRTMAYRDAIINDAAPGSEKTIRQTVRHTWQVARRNPAEVFILIAILWGVQYVFNLLLSVFNLPLGLATAVPIFLNASGGAGTAVSILVGLVTAVLLAIPQALLFVYVAVVWTLAYLNWSYE